MDEKTKEALDHLEGTMNLLDGINADDRAALATLKAALEDLASFDVLSFSLADYDKGVLSATILIDRLRAMLHENGKKHQVYKGHDILACPYCGFSAHIDYWETRSMEAAEYKAKEEK